MENEKITNLLSDVDNESSKFATKIWYVINDQNTTNYSEGNEDSAIVNLKLESLNQIFVIIQIHIFL